MIVLDFVLGYGSNPDPVGSVIDEIKKAKQMAAKAKRHLSIIAHVCGTRRDPQGYDQSLTRLKDAGVPVLPTNAFAAIAGCRHSDQRAYRFQRGLFTVYWRNSARQIDIMTSKQKKLLDSDLTVLNIGMNIFYEALRVQNVKVIQVDWKPGPVLDKLSEEILSKIM